MTRRRLCAGAALLVSLAGCGDSATSPTTAPAPSSSQPEEVVCFDGSYEPAEEGEVVSRDEVCPDEQSSPSPTASWEVTAAFLSPEEAAAAEEPGWSVSEPYEPDAGPVLDPCGDRQFPEGDAIAASNERQMTSTREAGGSELVQEVFRYRSEQEAADAFAGYADAVERCPANPDPAAPGQQVRYQSVLQDEAEGVQRLLVQRRPCVGPDQCPPIYASYYVVARTGDGLTAASYAQGEDGDPADAARAVLDAIADQLSEAVQR